MANKKAEEKTTKTKNAKPKTTKKTATKKVETSKKETVKETSTKEEKQETVKAEKKTPKKSTAKKKTTKKETTPKKEEIVVKEIKSEEDVEEKLSKTLIEKTKQFFDESDEYVESALALEEDEKTREFENTQIIKIREALKPIRTEKKHRRKKSQSNIDEEFLDVNNKEDHIFLKLFIIIGIIAVFIWAMPKIAYRINKHFVINSEYTPYVPPKEDTPKKPTKVDEDEKPKSETELTKEDVKELLDSLSADTLSLPTSTSDYTLEFQEHNIEINGVECYIVDVNATINDTTTHIANFAVSTYGEKIFKMNNDNGGYEEIKF